MHVAKAISSIFYTTYKYHAPSKRMGRACLPVDISTPLHSGPAWKYHMPSECMGQDICTPLHSGRAGKYHMPSECMGVSSIKYTTNCLCHMHWLSPISLIIIGILPIVHSLYSSCFCIAEALWTPMDSFQLYSHLVRIRSAA